MNSTNRTSYYNDGYDSIGEMPMNSTKKMFYIILAACILFAVPADSWFQKKKTIEGVEYITNPKKPSPPNNAQAKLILTEDLSIGGVEKQEEIFSETVLINVDENENIYIADMKLNNIKVFDPSGGWIRTIGKQGQGPGELNMPTGIQITEDGNLMVEEVMNRRLSFFTPEGKFIKSVSTADKTSLTGLLIGPKGTMVGRELVVDQNKMFWTVKKYDSALKELFTIDKVEFPNPLAGKINPFELMIIFNLDANGNIVYGTSKEYEIKFFNPQGMPIKSITRKYDPVKISEKDKEEILERMPETGEINLKERIEFPKHYPAFQHFTLDDEGRIFVRTFRQGKQEGEYMLDIFDPEGRFISQMPLKANPVLWKNNKLYSTEETDQGFIIIKRYKVSWE
ncbi:MAG: 6-bladed beta-propeller [Candidatus Aminicenantes bacterium]|nr:6-bladed beta-propeller [Candidatus Aminicenantes bacterium]